MIEGTSHVGRQRRGQGRSDLLALDLFLTSLLLSAAKEITEFLRIARSLAKPRGMSNFLA